MHFGDKMYHITKCSMEPMTNSFTLGVEWSWFSSGKKFYQKRFSDCLEHDDKYLRGNKLMTGYIFSADVLLTA